MMKSAIKQFFFFLVFNPVLLLIFYLSLNIPFIRKFIVNNLIYPANKHHRHYEQLTRILRNKIQQAKNLTQESNPSSTSETGRFLELMTKNYHPQEIDSRDITGNVFYFGKTPFDAQKNSVIYVTGYLQSPVDAMMLSVVCTGMSWCEKYYNKEDVNTFIWVHPPMETFNDWSAGLEGLIRKIAAETKDDTQITLHATSMGTPVALDACSHFNTTPTLQKRLNLVTFLPLSSLNIAVSDFVENYVGSYASRYVNWYLSSCLEKIQWSMHSSELLKKLSNMPIRHYSNPRDCVVGRKLNHQIFSPSTTQHQLTSLEPLSESYCPPSEEQLSFSQWNQTLIEDLKWCKQDKSLEKKIWDTRYRETLASPLFRNIAHARSPSDFKHTSIPNENKTGSLSTRYQV